MKYSFDMEVSILYNIPRFLHSLAKKHNLIISIEKYGFIFINYFITLEGSKIDIYNFLDEMYSIFDDINNIK